ncbi:MAG: hypothetical protein AB8B79_21025 [Granulosicoccus sp.]
MGYIYLMVHTTHMLNVSQSDELIDHLCRQSPLTASEAQRLVSEVLAFYDESVHGFIRRRHHELQKSGLTNSSIYRLIGEELKQHRFMAEPFTERQIRRAIYG